MFHFIGGIHAARNFTQRSAKVHSPDPQRAGSEGRRTSVRLEPEFWAGLNELLEEEKVSLDQFCDYVQRRKGQASFSSTMRAQILEYFRRR